MIQLVVFDLDGTLFRGDEVVEGAPQALARFRSQGILIRFLTNNSGYSAEVLAEKLNRLGFQASPQEVMGTGPFALQACQQRNYRSVFVIGENGLHSLFSGYETEGDDADAVVVGVDRRFTYAKCDRAMQLIRRGAHFLATNRDATYPIEGGRVQPGAGAMVAAVESASGVSPEVLGKPEPQMILQILADANVDPQNALVVGDRVETDILAGQRAGCKVALVLTGATLDPAPGIRTVISVNDLEPLA